MEKKRSLNGMLENTAKTIVRAYEGRKPKLRLMNEEDMRKISVNQKQNRTISEMKENELVIQIPFIANSTKARLYPVEVYAVFDYYLTLVEKCLIENVAAIQCLQRSGLNSDNYNSSSEIFISREEFWQFYTMIDSSNTPRKDVAKMMGDVWVVKNQYNRFRLVFEEEKEYRAALITPWKLVGSGDKEFDAYYSFRGNSLSVLYPERSWKVVFYQQIENEGAIFGAWDEENNIWFYGETIGLIVYQYLGDQQWERSDHADFTLIPDTMRKALDDVARHYEIPGYTDANVQ